MCLFIIQINDGRGRYVTKTTPHTVAYINGHNTIVECLENAGATPVYVSVYMNVVEINIQYNSRLSATDIIYIYILKL